MSGSNGSPEAWVATGTPDQPNLDVRFTPRLMSLAKDLAIKFDRSIEDVTVKALLNEKVIVERREQGRQFQMHDRRQGIARVDFVWVGIQRGAKSAARPPSSVARSSHL